jgi:predicted dinucleotide-binding enzyme
VFISSGHDDVSAKVARLAEELGFAPIEVGKIGEGARLKPPAGCRVRRARVSDSKKVH